MCYQTQAGSTQPRRHRQAASDSEHFVVDWVHSGAEFTPHVGVVKGSYGYARGDFSAVDAGMVTRLAGGYSTPT